MFPKHQLITFSSIFHVCQNLPALSYVCIFCVQKSYTDAWDKIKAKAYQIPSDSHALSHAKQQKVILSGVKYKEDYEKFKSLYSLPKSMDDDPSTARCLKAGKLCLDVSSSSSFSAMTRPIFSDVFDKHFQ